MEGKPPVKEPSWLLDGCSLVALFATDHLHHRKMKKWFEKRVQSFATCSVTQGTLLRLLLTLDKTLTSDQAWSVLRAVVQHPFHEFWDDGFSYLEIHPKLIQGHRQITDAWLVELARKRKGRLATLDLQLAEMYPRDVQLITDFN